MAQLILLNKPFHVMSQFSPIDDKKTLAQFINIKAVYPAGRLDYDSEGLLLLTDSGTLQHQISHPDKKEWKTYYAQVEGIPNQQAIDALIKGVELKDGLTKPAKAELVEAPDWLWNREPPIRQRNNDIISWIKLSINEGKNRQVRRMTAHIGHPTLRLIRYQIGDWTLEDISEPGEFKALQVEVKEKPKKKHSQTFTKHKKGMNYKGNKEKTNHRSPSRKPTRKRVTKR